MRRYAKTAVAVIGAMAAVLLVALDDDTMTMAEWVQVAAAAVTALGVYAIPNRPPEGEPARPDISEQGLSEIGLIVVAVLVAVAVVVILWAFTGR